MKKQVIEVCHIAEQQTNKKSPFSERKPLNKINLIHSIDMEWRPYGSVN